MTGIGALMAAGAVLLVREPALDHRVLVFGMTVAVLAVPLVEAGGKWVRGLQRKLVVAGEGGAMRVPVPYQEVRSLVQAWRWGGVGAWGLTAAVVYSGGPGWLVATAAGAAFAAGFLAGYVSDPAAGI